VVKFATFRTLLAASRGDERPGDWPGGFAAGPPYGQARDMHGGPGGRQGNASLCVARPATHFAGGAKFNAGRAKIQRL